MNMRSVNWPFIFLTVVIVGFLWSAVDPVDPFGWMGLSIPILLMTIILIGSYRWMRLTTFAYFMMLLYLVILMLGTKYSYLTNPFFDAMRIFFDQSRNHFDRFTHISFGFFPVFVLKEFLLRQGYFRRNKVFYCLLLCIILSFAALWELTEFAATAITKLPAQYMLGSQGDPWDTHWDMLMSVVGAGSALFLFGKIHDRQMEDMTKSKRNAES